MQEIITIISSIVNTAVVPLLGYFVFYNAKKRTAEADATRAETDNAVKVAHEWQLLYEQRDKRVDELNAKIDQLYADIARYRDDVLRMREEQNALQLRFDTADYNKCTRKSCAKRLPPRSNEAVAKDNK